MIAGEHEAGGGAPRDALAQEAHARGGAPLQQALFAPKLTILYHETSLSTFE